MKWLAWLLIIVSLPLWAESSYRMERYRAPTPQHVPGAQTLDTAGLQKLLAAEQVLLIDVMAVTYRPETMYFDGEWLLNEAHYNIPGSIWLPNVGYGQLDQTLSGYFVENLKRLTHGDKDHPLVFYCILDCWMAWNASKRAAQELGYQQVYWYREGMDGWEEAELPIAENRPVPLL